MVETLKLFILAGEPSGDRIAADLVARLRHKVEVSLTGVGGDELTGQGLTPLFPMSDLAVMGITDVLKRLPLLLWRIEQTARAIIATAPDVVVLVDAQDFSKLVAKRLRRLGYAGPLLLYVAPSVWARAPQRAGKLRPLFDEVLAVLPFEPRVMAELGGPPTSYVGHPALAETAPAAGERDNGLVALLPGSREGELRRHLPMLREVAQTLSAHQAVTGFFIPTLPSLSERLRTEISGWPVPVTIEADRQARKALYARSILAVTVAGTATLELALASVPMVLTYVMDTPQARAFDKLGRPPVGLPNIILGRPAMPELVTARADAAALGAAALQLLDDKKARQDQIRAFGELASLMERGEAGAPRQDPADRILSHWKKN
jgi:lipid-A-disaccharide synthase